MKNWRCSYVPKDCFLILRKNRFSNFEAKDRKTNPKTHLSLPSSISSAVLDFVFHFANKRYCSGNTKVAKVPLKTSFLEKLLFAFIILNH